MRPDITWTQALDNWAEPKPSLFSNVLPPPLLQKVNNHLNIEEKETFRRTSRAKTVRRGYWLDRNNRRKAFIQFASSMGFDPYDPQQWQDVSYTQFIKKQVLLLPTQVKATNGRAS